MATRNLHCSNGNSESSLLKFPSIDTTRMFNYDTGLGSPPYCWANYHLYSTSGAESAESRLPKSVLAFF